MNLIVKLSRFAFAIAAAIIGFCASSADAAEVTIVDLSKDIERSESFNDSTGWDRAYNIFSERKEISTAQILQHGKLVGQYVRDDSVDVNNLVHQWSITKTVVAFLVGILKEKYSVSFDTTLGEFFSNYENAFDLVNTTYVDKMKNTTLYQLLTMTSSFSDDFVYPIFFPCSSTTVADCPLAGGGTLQTALSWPNLASNDLFQDAFGFPPELNPDNWHYTPTWSIMGYIFKEVTGLNTMELLTRDVLPSLGIKMNDIAWPNIDIAWTNSAADGPALFYENPPPFSSLFMNIDQVSKLFQLFLQGGNDGQGHQIVSSEYMQEMTRGHVVLPSWWEADHLFGYLTYIALPNSNNTNNEIIYRASGGQGKRHSWSPSVDMVVTINGDADNSDDPTYYFGLFDGKHDFGPRPTTISPQMPFPTNPLMPPPTPQPTAQRPTYAPTTTRVPKASKNAKRNRKEF